LLQQLTDVSQFYLADSGVQKKNKKSMVLRAAKTLEKNALL
jgi:hypothetical protein